MNIQELLDRYFEGETSATEEQQLRDYFAGDEVAPEWMVYKPLFVYFAEEIAKDEAVVTLQPKGSRAVYFWATGVAAAILVILAVQFFRPATDPCLCMENYVVINGRCYTDQEMARSFAFGALREVAEPAEDYFPQPDDILQEQHLMEQQLKELSNIFNDED